MKKLSGKDLTPKQREYLEYIDAPDRDSINSNWNPADRKVLRLFLGEPKSSYSTQCENSKIESVRLRDRLVTRSVGPFRVTGVDVAVASLAIALKEVEKTHPELYKILGSAGMLCVRKVRGAEVPSIHSWGCAIDFTIGGVLDPYGDGTVQKGLLDLYSVLKKHGWYWGASFKKEDGMHFELSAQRLRTLLNLSGQALTNYLKQSV
jgi:hypothetical protein